MLVIAYFLYGLLIAIALTTHNIDIYGITEQPINKQNDLPLQVEERYSVPLVALTTLAIIASVALYYYQENRSKKEKIERSRRAILKEVLQNKKALTSNVHDHIAYTTKTRTNGQKIVEYTNAYLEADSYNSVLYSGLLTYFSIPTLHTLTMLYSRIKSRNDLLTYMDHLEDMFFLYDDAQVRLDTWNQKIQKYDVLISSWESEIIELLNEAELLLLRERSKRIRFSYHHEKR